MNARSALLTGATVLGLLLVFIGERLLGAGAGRVAADMLGVLLVAGAAVLRWSRSALASTAPRARVERTFALLSTVAVLALLAWFIQSDVMAAAGGPELSRSAPRLATALQIPVGLAWAMLHTQALSVWDEARWQRDVELHKQLGAKYYALSVAVAEIRGRVVRASSVIENVNSRLRSYFFLRRELGADYLGLLQFFLNHRRFLRSEHAERADQSPAELLTGQAHTHWLELLGFIRFVRK